MGTHYIQFGSMNNYSPSLSLRETERAIKFIKDHFERELAAALHLERVSAPLFVIPESGLNDDLNGVERKVSFDVKSLEGQTVEVVQSLAKWKRNALGRYGFAIGEGLYTDMNAIRRDETLSNLHSVYVDQWDWEMAIRKEDRNMDFLKEVVGRIYQVIRNSEIHICRQYPAITPILPHTIYFITSQDLEDLYPELTPKERENRITEQYGAVFVSQIGGTLRSGMRHDGRAPDYDDWELNGDILLWFPVLGCALEISSMGIRVDENSLVRQLQRAECESRIHLPFHQAILNRRLPYTIGGGLGQSRLCMYFLRKAHVGEVQASVWPEELQSEFESQGIQLL